MRVVSQYAIKNYLAERFTIYFISQDNTFFSQMKKVPPSSFRGNARQALQVQDMMMKARRNQNPLVYNVRFKSLLLNSCLEDGIMSLKQLTVGHPTIVIQISLSLASTTAIDKTNTSSMTIIYFQCHDPTTANTATTTTPQRNMDVL